MYKITYLHDGASVEQTLYLPGDETYSLTDAVLSLTCGQAGELTVSIPPTNPARSGVVCLTDEVIVYRDGAELWRGRPITWQSDFNRTGQLTCEGVLAYLYDTWYPPYDFSGSPDDLIADVLAKHNARVEDRKKIQVGTITVSDPNDYIARSNIDYSRSLSVLSDKLVAESLGGYLRVRVANGVKYLDYLDGYGTTATQPVQLGVNLLDLAETVEYSGTISAVLPLGAADEETGERLTVSSVNGGNVYVYDANLVAEYGWIAEAVTWDDVTLPANLLSRAQAYLQQSATGVRTLTVRALDLSLISDDYASIHLGDMVHITSAPHGVDLYMELTALELHLLDPASDVMTFGAQTAAYTEQIANADRQVAQSLNQVTTTLKNLAANTITVDYLSANYATITNLEAALARIDELEAGKITVDWLDATFVRAEDILADNMTAAEGTFTHWLTGVNLLATNIKGGTIDAGEIEVVNLNCANLTVGTINGQQIAPGAIDESKLSDALAGTLNQTAADVEQALTEAGLLQGSVEALEEEVAAALTTANGKSTAYYQASAPSGGSYQQGDLWFDTSNGYQLHRYINGLGWTGVVFGTDAIAANAITATELAASAVTAGKIAAGAVTTDKLAASAVTAAKIDAGAVTASKIAAGAISANHLAANSVTADAIAAGVIQTEHLAVGTVTTDRLAAQAVTADKLAATSVTATKIAANAVTTDKLAANAVTTDKLSANAVTADKINVTDLFAQDITATGTISGAHLVGATGSFSGSVTAGSGKIGGWGIADLALYTETDYGSIELYPVVSQEVVSDGFGGVIVPHDTIIRIQGHPSINATAAEADALQDFFSVSQWGQVNAWNLTVSASQIILKNLSVGGSLSAYNGWTMPRIQHGSTSVPTSAGSSTDFTISFPKSFPGTPDVVVTPRHNSSGLGYEMRVKLKTVSATGATGVLYSGNGGTWALHWVAVY